MRFKEFIRKWDKKTFDDLAYYKKGPFGSALTKSIFVHKSNTTVKVYEQQNAINKNWKLERYFITKDYYNKMKSFTIRGGDIIVSCAGTIGEIYELPQEAETGIINQALMKIEVQKTINKEFFKVLFSNMISSFSQRYSNGSAIKNIPPFADLKSYVVYLPCKEEQDKIASFLTLIDRRIDTQSKIIEDLELFKNMISYKVLYDDKTACYKPLSSFSELKNGYAFKSNTYSSKGDYQIVTIANVSGNRYIDLTSSNKILNIPNDIQSHQILKINDILISLTGNVGRVSYCNKLNCLLNQRVGLLSIKNKDLIEYIFQCIHNKIFEKTMISRGQGVAQLNIGKYDVESFEIPVYSQDRMNTISEVLKLIDFKIIKEKDILELYKKQKAYLLKNMFI